MADKDPKIIPLDEFLDQGYTEGFGMTRQEAQKQEICVQCKKPIHYPGIAGDQGAIYTEAGLREYRMSAMCESCFDSMFEEEE